MSKPKHKRPRPPKEWYPTGKALPTISGYSGERVVVHPSQFKKLLEAGLIDEQGNRP